MNGPGSALGLAGFGAVKAMFDQISNEHNKLNKNQKNKKTCAHSLLMAYTNDLSW